MAESKKTSITFTFEDRDDGRYNFTATGDPIETDKLYILWTACMERLIECPDLLPDKKVFIRNVYNHVMTPADKIAAQQEKFPMRIVTVYKSSHEKDIFVAVEYHTLGGDPERTGWMARGSYKKVTEAIRKAFGILEKIARDPNDDPSVVESWI